MTPPPLAAKIVSRLDLRQCRRVLEPSCGDGSFLAAIADRIGGRSDNRREKTELIGIEIDPELVNRSRCLLSEKSTKGHQVFHGGVYQADFFHAYLTSIIPGSDRADTQHLRHNSFDLIIGNPPFGGTFDPRLEDLLDRRLGRRMGKKIKKETYAFFVVACLDLLRAGGRLVMICSDTLLTIPTMTGLRNLLMEKGEVRLSDIREFSSETNYPMLVLDFLKGGRPRRVSRNSVTVSTDAIRATPNLSWGITPELAQFFTGPMLSQYFIASSGMTTGNNALFVRKVRDDGTICEPYQFEFYDAPVTVAYEIERSRLGKMSARRRASLQAAELRGDTQRRVRVVRREENEVIRLPDTRYRPYNKSANGLVYSDPTHYIYWKDEGDAVLTYKRTGNWYLRGVGGQPFFGREGLTWRLVSSRFLPRYLPPGYILDSGAPCGFLRPGVPREELFFVIGWLLSDLANRILKTVINHTRNIQSKDFERMPYPWWVSDPDRMFIIRAIKDMIKMSYEGASWQRSDRPIREISNRFDVPMGGPDASVKVLHSHYVAVKADTGMYQSSLKF